MKIIKIVRVEEKIPTTFAKKIKEKAEERAIKDSEFAAKKWYEQLEIIMKKSMEIYQNKTLILEAGLLMNKR